MTSYEAERSLVYLAEQIINLFGKEFGIIDIKQKAKEPLIKDDKIRKAVRAWAEAIGATRNIVFNGSWKICSFFYENNKGGFEKLLIYGDNDLEELKRYTITELCGEEEDGD